MGNNIPEQPTFNGMNREQRRAYKKKYKREWQPEMVSGTGTEKESKNQ